MLCVTNKSSMLIFVAYYWCCFLPKLCFQYKAALKNPSPVIFNPVIPPLTGVQSGVYTLSSGSKLFRGINTGLMFCAVSMRRRLYLFFTPSSTTFSFHGIHLSWLDWKFIAKLIFRPVLSWSTTISHYLVK
jgi:hypothetical protein